MLSEIKQHVVPEDFNPTEYLPHILPSGWRLVHGGNIGDDGASYSDWVHRRTVIVSISKEDDGRLWMHASIAKPGKLPSWVDLMDMKDIFIGRDRVAYQVLPPKARHVNIHPNCLHLFCPLEGEPPLPDFTRGGSSL